MRNVSILLLTLFSLCGCSVAKLAYLSSDEATPAPEGFVWENDTLRIVHNTWTEFGTTSFSITNKLDIPIYIDWFKSNLIVNGEVVKYWTAKARITATTSDGTNSGELLDMLLDGSVQNTSGTITPQERMTFIAPGVTIKRRGISLKGTYKPASPADSTLETGTFSKGEIITVKYSRQSTPLLFRNFITYATDSDFEKENFIDLTFWVEQVKTMKVKELNNPKLLQIRPHGFYVRNQR